jgi:hypothetical protein
LWSASHNTWLQRFVAFTFLITSFLAANKKAQEARGSCATCAFLRPYLFSGLALYANHLFDFSNNFDQVFLVFHYCLD